MNYESNIAPPGSSIYYSVLYVPTVQRQTIIAARAFSRELTDIVLKCQELSVAQQKIHWWQEELHRLKQGTPQHPITQTLLNSDRQLPWLLLEEIIAGVSADAITTLYTSNADLQHFHHHTAGATERFIAHILGFKHQETLAALDYLGIFMQKVAYLRDLRISMQRDRTYLAGEMLVKHRANLRQIATRQTTENLRDLFAEQATWAEQDYQHALELLPANDRYMQLPSLILARLHSAILQEIRRAGFPVLQQRISITPLRKYWLAWRTYRFEKNRVKIG